MISSLLSTVGLEQFIAKDEADYLRIATAPVGGLPALAALRASLRIGWQPRRCMMSGGSPGRWKMPTPNSRRAGALEGLDRHLVL